MGGTPPEYGRQRVARSGLNDEQIFMISKTSATRLRATLGLQTSLLLSVAGCGSAQVSTADGDKARNVVLVHEPCNLDSARTVDVNGDGRPDIWHVETGGREVCRAIDLNLDGIKDAFIYYDAEGRERRRESDFDRDGFPDEISYSEAGVIVRKERETNYDAKLDTWDYYEGGRLVRRERDSTGDGNIDQWWSFNRPEDPKCAVVASDGNADGQPDPGTEVDLCGESYKAPPPPAPSAARVATEEAAQPAASAAAPPAASAAAPPATSAPAPTAPRTPPEAKP